MKKPYLLLALPVVGCLVVLAPTPPAVALHGTLGRVPVVVKLFTWHWLTAV